MWNSEVVNMINITCHCLTLFIFIECGAFAFTLPNEGLWKLDIIHYNDFHARFEETSVRSQICKSDDSACLGGFPRLYAAVNLLLQEKPSALLLNAGDSFQGTYWYTLFKWNITQQFMNMLPHDAHAIGNHEFDDGPEGLAPYLMHLEAPCLAANMDTSDEPILQHLYKNHTIVERNGRRIGIIGVITVSTKLYATPGNTRFGDERVAAQREAAKLAGLGVDIIVLLSHAGLNVDRDIAANYSEHIDIIVGGHTHSLLWNGPAPSGEEVADSYPVIVQSNNNHDHKVLIVQASAFTKYMGNLSVYFDYRGDYQSWEGGPIFLNRDYPEDSRVKELLAPYAKLVHTATQQVWGHTEVELSIDPCVFGECLIGNAVSDAFMQESQSKFPSELPQVTIVARGNIRGGVISPGSITAGDVFAMLEFRDRVNAFNIKGKHVKRALEYSVSQSWQYKPFKGPILLQVAGMRVVFNVSRPVNSRVVSVMLWNKDGERYVPLDEDRLVRVTAPAYIANGGDGYTMLAENRIDQVEVGRDFDIFRSYLERNDPIHPTIEGRVIIQE